MHVLGPGTHWLGQKVICQGYSQQWPENLVNTISQNQWKEFYPILVTDVCGFTDVLISLWVKGQGHSRQWAEEPGEYNIFISIWANFTKIKSRMLLDLEHTD